MLPVLLEFKIIKIYTFGVFLVLAFFWGTFLLWKLIRMTVHKEEEIFDGLFFSLASAIFFGRLTYVLLHFKDFGFDFFKFLLINGYPGLSLYGALLGGFIALYLFFLKKKIPFAETVDYFIPSVFLSLAFGKIGGFFSGSEVGTKTKFLLAVRYFGFDGHRHLTALYAGLLFFLGCYLSYRLIFEIRKEKYHKGFVFCFFAWFFALVNFSLGKIKQGNLYFDEVASMILLLTFSFYFLYYFRSPVINFLSRIINSSKNYGQKTYQNVHRLAKRKTGKRSEKNSSTD
jgi:phosphatidylglycerol:prolipoprotein diacylglycerol transferase